jgi:Leucine-rich repeat (LRR) protein
MGCFGHLSRNEKMNRLQGSNDVDVTNPVIAQEHGPNTEFIKNAIPDWLINTSPQRRAAVRGASATIPPWYNTASLEQRKEMTRLTEASILSQTALDTVMASVTDIGAFAEPLLIKALADTHNVHLDVHKVRLRLRKLVTIGSLEIEVSSFTVMTLSLLDAALHNFEAYECEPGAFHTSSGFVTENAGGIDEPIVTTLSVEAFTTLCRTLDIGQLYQNHLKSKLLPEDAVAQAMLSRTFIGCQKDALQAAAYMALVKNDIELNDYNIILKVIADEQNIMNGNAPVWFWEPVLLGHILTGCMVFATVEKYKYGVDEAILYIPHDPEHPVKKYRVSPQPELTRRLLATVTSPGKAGQATDFPGFLSQFIDYKDRPLFFNRLTQKAANAPVDPLAPLRPPIVSQVLLPVLLPVLWGPSGTFLTPNTLPPETPSPREPVTELNIHLTYRNREGLWAENGDPWVQLFQRSRDKILSDARSHAVPTADADAKTRADKIAHWLEAGMAVLNVVSMFVPVLGEVMLGVMAGQLMYETLEGAVEWSEGDREAAWAHLMDVAENLALIGVMAGGGRILKGVKASSFVDGLKPVQLPSGETRLWKPDLGPYQANIDLPSGSVPDQLGLHTVEGQQVLSLDNQPYVVSQNPATGEHFIQHPALADAYTPLLEHNGEGGWVHEGEEPLSWDGPTLMRRLGYRADAFSDAQLEQVRIANGLEPDQLRQMHAEQTPPSALLTDTLSRFRIDRDIQTFDAQINSDDPAVFGKADPRLQFQIMRSRGLLPDTPPLRVMDSKARIVWEDVAHSHSSPRKLVMALSGAELASGKLLNSLLQMLEAQGVDLAQVAGEPGTSLDLRAKALRKDIADAVRNNKATLFESLYRAHDATTNGSEQRINAFFPTLPSSVARQILQEATAEDLVQINRQGPLPQSVFQQARWCQQELRVARAYEGFYLDASANTDSQRLLLRSLANLPGWPSGIRFELREYWEQGRVLDAVGDEHATQRKVLVVGEDGRFTEAPTGDLYSAALQALSEDERQTLGFALSEAERLKQVVQQAPLSRDVFSDALLKHRKLRPSFEPGSKLPGGIGGSLAGVYPLNFLRSNRGRIRKLYPDFSEVEVETFLQSLGSDVRGALNRQEAQYANLKRELKAWLTRSSRLPFASNEMTQRQIVVQTLKRCWRRQSGTTLKLHQRVELPGLSTDFSHVEILDLQGPSFERGADAFLENFTRLRQLTISGGAERLTQLPSSLGRMNDLTRLNVSDNSIVLTDQEVSTLEGMTQLTRLELNNNPLLQVPDFSGMNQLRHIDLSRTGIARWPLSLAQLPGLEFVNLSNNRLQEVPAGLLLLSGPYFREMTNINWNTVLDNNPFSQQGLQQLRNYRRLIRLALPYLRGGIWDQRFDVTATLRRRYLTLYSDSTVEQIEDHFVTWGSLNEIEASVSAREAEFDQLKRQLTRWGGGSRPVHRRIARRDPREALYDAGARIRRCWQRRTPQQLNSAGGPIGLELDLSDLQLPDLPELDADFSHVGCLTLRNMGWTSPPEAFMRRFSGVQWLDMSYNELTELPQALDGMNQLTRLALGRNRIILSPGTGRLLSERTMLRSLDLTGNPLGMTPDFSAMTELQGVSLGSTGISVWPTGLSELSQLGTIDLRNNALVTIPEEVIAPSTERFEQIARLNNATFLQGNPLSEATRQQLIVYWDRLERERPDIAQERSRPPAGPMGFEYQPPIVVVAESRLPLNGQATWERWSSGLATSERAARRIQWRTLFAREHSSELLAVLTGLDATGSAQVALQQRVWSVIDSITQSNPESAQLREEMFEWAGEPACCDRAALTFSNLEIKSMVYKARVLAREGQQSPALLSLARGLFRLDAVEKIALADIQRRIAAINRAPGFSQQQKIRQIALLEDVEIKLAYRVGLQDLLELPAQPASYRYTAMSDVSPDMLKHAYSQTMALNNSAAEFQALVSRDFWREFLVSKYKSQFDQVQTPYQTRQASLDQALDAAELDEPAYTEQTTDLDAQLQIEEAALVEVLTRQELIAHPY